MVAVAACPQHQALSPVRHPLSPPAQLQQRVPGGRGHVFHRVLGADRIGAGVGGGVPRRRVGLVDAERRERGPGPGADALRDLAGEGALDDQVLRVQRPQE